MNYSAHLTHLQSEIDELDRIIAECRELDLTDYVYYDRIRGYRVADQAVIFAEMEGN